MLAWRRGVKIDWPLIAAIAAMAAMSLVTIYSIASNLFWYQLVWFALGVMIVFLFAHIDWRPLITYRWIVFGIYLAAVALLVATYFFAPSIRGVRSWLVFGPLQLQTSEITKLALIILFSYYFARRHIGIAHWQNILIPFLYFIVPAGLVLLQPDLGSFLVLFGLWGGYLLVSGIRWRHLAIGFVLIGIISVVGWNISLEDYHRERIIGLFDQSYDPLGINYSAIQSKIAIGSAGFWGKGFQQGTQTQLGFLTEAASDFTFSAFVEEWGLFGALSLLSVFMFLMFRIIKIGTAAENNFSKLICLGAVILLLLQFSINIGSVISLLPVIGISLPFFSYGGSNLLVVSAIVGIVQSTNMR